MPLSSDHTGSRNKIKTKTTSTGAGVNFSGSAYFNFSGWYFNINTFYYV